MLSCSTVWTIGCNSVTGFQGRTCFSCSADVQVWGHRDRSTGTLPVCITSFGDHCVHAHFS
uniref:Uncharacterized protein n=1 Tax=Anguilla anguilla TaxID=7936 RepID=A0A0E9Q6G6_ANGAN